jgi:endogenous inhibitor of DNA gyrase (YacG/DUF329 family)
MSGTSYEGECPKCGKAMQSYSDYKPYDLVDHRCLHCGFYAWMHEERMTLKVLNAERRDAGMRTLKKLPGWEE